LLVAHRAVTHLHLTSLSLSLSLSRLLCRVALLGATVQRTINDRGFGGGFRKKASLVVVK